MVRSWKTWVKLLWHNLLINYKMICFSYYFKLFKVIG